MIKNKLCINKVAIPFNFTDIKINLEHFSIQHLSSNLLRNNVNDLLGKENKNKICKSYLLNDSFYINYSITKKGVFCCRNDLQVPIKLNSISVHFFESNIGFLVIDFTHYLTELIDFVNLNFYLTELKINKGNSNKTNFIKSDKVNDISIIDICKNIINDKSINFIEYKPVIFDYIYTNEKVDDDLLISQLFNNAKESFKFKSVPKTLQVYENSQWGASVNGVVNVSYEVEDITTNKSFGKFKDNVNEVYFYLFLNVLNQKFALSKFVDSIKYNVVPNLSYDELKDEYDKCISLKKSLSQFIHRNFFDVPSTNSYINSYFDHIYDAFEIDVLHQFLKNEIISLAEISKEYIDEIELISEGDREIRKCYLDMILIFTGCIISYSTIINLFEFFVAQSIFKDTIVFNIIFLIILAVVIIAIPNFFNIKNNISKIKYEKNKIKNKK